MVVVEQHLPLWKIFSKFCYNLLISPVARVKGMMPHTATCAAWGMENRRHTPQPQHMWLEIGVVTQ